MHTNHPQGNNGLKPTQWWRQFAYERTIKGYRLLVGLISKYTQPLTWQSHSRAYVSAERNKICTPHIWGRKNTHLTTHKLCCIESSKTKSKGQVACIEWFETCTFKIIFFNL